MAQGKDNKSGKEMIKIRIDDFPQGTPFDRKPNLFYYDVLKVLEERKLDYYLGVIPEAVNDMDLEFLSKLKFAHIAMHGFNHGFPKWGRGMKCEDIPPSEFINMSYMEILEKVAKGMILLSKFLPIKVFTPPFNMFNQDILDALNVYKFEIITGGAETIRELDYKNFKYGNLKLIMSLEQFYTSNGNIEDILEKLPFVPDDQMLTIHLPNTTSKGV